MKREDANPTAFRAVHAILEAAHDCTVPLGAVTATVQATRLPGAGWPDGGLDGLSERQDGAWPPTVELKYTWPGGHATLRAWCSWWQTSDSYRHLVGITVRRAHDAGEVVWVTFGNPVRKAKDGKSKVFATLGFNRHKETEKHDEWLGWRDLIRAQADRAGLHRATPANVELCTVAVPDGSVGPSAKEAFVRLARVALLKLIVLGRYDSSTVHGTPPFRLTAPSTAPPPQRPAPVADGQKRAGLWPLPGGVRSYMATLEALLSIIEEEGLDREGLYDRLERRWGVTGETSRKAYIKLLDALGLAEEGEAGFSLMESGARWLGNPTGAELFPILHRAFTGVLAMLVLIQEREPLSTEDAQLLHQLLGVTWKTKNQVSFRRNWLLSMGLTEREDGADRLTTIGTTVLDANASEVAALRPRIAALSGSTGTPGSLPPGPTEEEEEEEVRAVAERLELHPDLIARHLGNFRPPPRVIEQCCAALTSGRHLLLVGPPGTGKTILAGILAAAARSEGYCAGLLTTTASADWTTFDTIGGYALGRGGQLRFQPGVFPRALAAEQWLLVDELNRADVDKAFGELMTVLSGKGTTTPYEDESGQPIHIGPEPGATYPMRSTFRVIATMNTWDKTSLFRLSTALQRRFATIHIGLPAPADYAALLEQEAQQHPPLAAALTKLVVDLFHPDSLLKYRAIGPAVPLDMIRYLRHRHDTPPGSHGLAEAIALSLLSQLEGLPPDDAKGVVKLLDSHLDGVSSAAARAELKERLLELFPILKRL